MSSAYLIYPHMFALHHIALYHLPTRNDQFSTQRRFSFTQHQLHFT